MILNYIIINIARRAKPGGGGFNVVLTFSEVATGNTQSIALDEADPLVAQATIGRAVNSTLSFP